MKRQVLLSIVMIWTGLFLYQCKPEPKISSDFRLNVRIKGDPGRLCPIFASSSADAREVYPYIFLQLGEYNPETLNLSPILAKTIPQVEDILDGPYKGGTRIEYEILADAVWQDGTPITADDYIFTIKAVKHPLVNADRWRNLLSKITEVNILSDDKKKFEVLFKEDYTSALELSVSIEFLPAHIYDSKQILTNISQEVFEDEKRLDELVKNDTSFTAFAEAFNQRSFHIQNMNGSGPYSFIEWETDQYILLRKKEDWWGDNYPDRPFLRAYPNEILFQIIPDETTAMALLKEGTIDVMSIKLSENFNNLKKDKTLNQKLSFHTPQLTNYYYLALNNKNTILQDKDVRRAIAHIIDVDNIIQTQEGNQGRRTVGMVAPFRPEYDSTLALIEYDQDKARDYLSKAGWADSNGDQILDKIIDGKFVSLSLRFYVFKSELGQRLGLITKENARKVGIDIELIQKDFRSFRKNELSNFDYDIAPMRRVLPLTEMDPYNSWHSATSDNAINNTCGYSNPYADNIIEKIQQEENDAKRKSLHRELQKVIYEDQACVFLYSPVERIVTSSRITPLISVKKPGYFVNSFSLVDESTFVEY